jgi:hypothetical protein
MVVRDRLVMKAIKPQLALLGEEMELLKGRVFKTDQSHPAGSLDAHAQHLRTWRQGQKD